MVRDFGNHEGMATEKIVGSLLSMGVTHILADWESAQFHSRLYPTEAHNNGVRFFKEEFIPKFLTVIFENNATTVYEIVRR
jgi:hypothetical protein